MSKVDARDDVVSRGVRLSTRPKKNNRKFLVENDENLIEPF